MTGPESVSQAAPSPSEISPAVLAEAISVRERFGLRADEAWVRAVATDPAAQAGVIEFGIPLAPAELTDLMGRRWDEQLFAEVRRYGQLFPDDYAGTFLNLQGSGVVIAFKDGAERHRTALKNLAADPSLIEVRDVEWSLEDLEGFVRQVEADNAWFAHVGLQYVQASVRVDENVVIVDFISPDEQASPVIRTHFGGPSWLKPRWLGPPTWTGPRANLTIKVVDTGGRPVRDIRCDVTPEDPRAEAEFGDSFFGTGPEGICAIVNIPTVAYRVSLHRYVDNDHYDSDAIKEFGLVLPSVGKIVEVTIPSG